MDAIAATIRPPCVLDDDRDLPEGIKPGTIEHALFLEWGDNYHRFYPNSMRRIILSLITSPLRPNDRDLLTQISRKRQLILAAATPLQLDLIEATLPRLRNYYRHLKQVRFDVELLHQLVLIKRCEMLTQHYPECESL